MSNQFTESDRERMSKWCERPDGIVPYNAICRLFDSHETLRAELDRLNADAVHSCGPDCMRPVCVLRRERADELPDDLYALALRLRGPGMKDTVVLIERATAALRARAVPEASPSSKALEIAGQFKISPWPDVSLWVAFSDCGAHIRMWSSEGPEKIEEAGLLAIRFVLADDAPKPDLTVSDETIGALNDMLAASKAGGEG